MAEIAKIEGTKENHDVLEKAQVGDMIEFVRGTYSHWAIYIGDGLVIHRWGENDGVGKSIGIWGNLTTVFGREFDKAKILESNMDDVIRLGGKARINNYLDAKYKPLDTKAIVNKARNEINKEGYNLIYSNCEHFATECRYGQPNCRQVQVAVGGSIAAGLFITGILAVTAYLLGSSTKKEEEKEEKEFMIEM